MFHSVLGISWFWLLGAVVLSLLPELVKEAGALWDRWLEERWGRGEDGYGPFMERIDARIAAAEAADGAN